jgi:hypothetical protein
LPWLTTGGESFAHTAIVLLFTGTANTFVNPLLEVWKNQSLLLPMISDQYGSIIK